MHPCRRCGKSSRVTRHVSQSNIWCMIRMAFHMQMTLAQFEWRRVAISGIFHCEFIKRKHFLCLNPTSSNASGSDSMLSSEFTLDVRHRNLSKHWNNIKVSLEWKSWCSSSLLFVPPRHMGTWTCIIICLHYSTLQVAVVASSSLISSDFLSSTFIVFFVVAFTRLLDNFHKFSKDSQVNVNLRISYELYYILIEKTFSVFSNDSELTSARRCTQKFSLLILRL